MSPTIKLFLFLLTNHATRVKKDQFFPSAFNILLAKHGWVGEGKLFFSDELQQSFMSCWRKFFGGSESKRAISKFPINI